MRAAMGRREATRRNLRREEGKGLEGEGLEFIARRFSVLGRECVYVLAVYGTRERRSYGRSGVRGRRKENGGKKGREVLEDGEVGTEGDKVVAGMRDGNVFLARVIVAGKGIV